MATLEITNIVSEDVYLADLYTSIAVGESKSIERSASDLPRMRSLQQAMADGKVSLAVTYSADEAASGLHAPPSTIEAGDMAPVAAATPAAGLAVIYKPFAAGGGGSPDDVEIFPAGSLPFKFRVVDFALYVSTAVGASSAEIRDEAGGGGNLLASASSAATGRVANAENATAVATPGATKGLFVRRSDDGVAGEAILFVRPEL
jgi:hypothetical protein